MSPGLVSRAAMALPASNTLPPPSPMTRSQSPAAVTPSRITSMVGSPCTSNSLQATPDAETISLTRGMASEKAPCTNSKRFGLSFNCWASSSSFPAPNRIRPAVANSNGDMLPGRVIWEEIVIFDAVPGLHHHLHDGIPPELVVSGLLVRAGGLRGLVHFDQYEAGRILALLDHVEACDACLLDAVPGIFEGRLFEGVHKFGFDMD